MKLNESGFSLLELLSAIVILGLLTAIALPQLAAHRIFAFNSRAISDLRNVINAEELYFIDNEVYSSQFSALPGLDELDEKLVINIQASGNSLRLSAHHTQGDQTYCYDSVTRIIREFEGLGSECP